MIFLLFLIVGLFLTLFLGQVHGYPGAIILGINAVLIDLFLQWLRFNLMRKGSNNYRLWWGLGIGFVLRIASIFLLLKLGLWWLSADFTSTRAVSFNPFYLFAIFLLSLPVWSLLMAYKFKNEVESL